MSELLLQWYFDVPASSCLLWACTQTVAALAVAETRLQFEHRDLHWGNILLKDLPAAEVPLRFLLGGTAYSLQHHGVQVNLVDFTLSRALLRGKRRAAALDELIDGGIQWLFAQEESDDMPQVRTGTFGCGAW